MRFERPSIGCKQSQNHTRKAEHGPILFPPDQRPHSRRCRGEDFDLVAAARGHAVKVAQELGRHGSPLGGRSISVTDEKGVVLFKTAISDEE